MVTQSTEAHRRPTSVWVKIAAIIVTLMLLFIVVGVLAYLWFGVWSLEGTVTGGETVPVVRPTPGG